MNLMHSRSWTSPTAAQRIQRRAGFTFTEIMFAVILLGIGFIMIAGMFPVAIQQTRGAVEDTTAAGVAQAAVRHLEQVWTHEKLICSDQDGDIADRPLVWSILDRADSSSLGQEGPKRSKADLQEGLFELWRRYRGSTVHAQNPRYAWTALYRRGGNANLPAGYAQVMIIVLESRSKQFFDQSDIESRNLEPRAVQITELRAGDPVAGTSDVITFNFNHGSKEDSVAEGSYVIIAGNETGSQTPPEAIGRIYRLGSAVNPVINTPARYYLAPGYGLTGDANSTPKRKDQELTSTTRAYVVGKSFTDNNNPNLGYSGPAMDIGVYTTYLALKQEQ